MTIVVIIPCRNVEHTLARQLAALACQTDPDFEVIISDNGSTDGTRAVARAWAHHFSALRVVDSSDQSGVAHARNTAIKACEAKQILICDGDDEVGPDWVAAMRTALAEHSACTGPLHLTVGGVDTGEIWNPNGVPTSMNHLSYMPGCNMGFSREAFDAVGGFDPTLAIGQEDVDFGWRLIAAGYDIGFAPHAIVGYEQRPTLWQTMKQKHRYGKAHVQLYRKHAGAGIPVQSLKWRIRWWVEWLKQCGTNGIRESVANGLTAAAFRCGCLKESARLSVKAPMW